MEGYIAEMRMFAGNFAPRGWAFCQGQILTISQNTALFALLGVTYGGNGQTTFALPDLRGRCAIGPGQGPGLPSYNLGNMGGQETRTLNAGNIGGHTHAVGGTLALPVSGEDGRKLTPINNVPAVNGQLIYARATDNTVMAGSNVSTQLSLAGLVSPVPVSNVKPYLGMNYIICMQGIFPSRN